MEQKEAEEIADALLTMDGDKYDDLIQRLSQEVEKELGQAGGERISDLVKYSQVNTLRSVVAMLSTHEAYVMKRVDERLAAIEQASVAGLKALEGLEQDNDGAV